MWESLAVVEISGEFELHLTVSGAGTDELRAFAEQRGVKYTEIELDRGTHRTQPMITVPATGTLREVIALGQQWDRELCAIRMMWTRIKVEAAPTNPGVPSTDEQAGAPHTYFEHHVKLLLPDDVIRRIELTELIEPLGARLSRNARKRRPDGAQERFVTQRCHRTGRSNARARLDALVAALRSTEYPILQVEEEYVAYDDGERYDDGWLPADRGSERDGQRRSAPAGSAGYPSTYQPIPATEGITQRAYFDPALGQYPHAFRPGAPVFADERSGAAWHRARQTATLGVLDAIAGSPWAEHLVLRGSVPLRTWFGSAAREPGDLDFVVLPDSMSILSAQAEELLSGVIDAVRGDAPVLAEEVETETIWTYERANGKRMVFPFEVSGLPRGQVQLDFVFQEPLPIAPETQILDGTDHPLLVAPPALALAWKLRWLATDLHPQAKDLYDAVLLAEHNGVSLELVRDLIRPDDPGTAEDFGPETVLSWKLDWGNLRDQHPDLPTEDGRWRYRLARALARHWG